MNKDYSLLCAGVENNRDMLLEAERHIWENPEPGYREWKTHEYLKAQYEKLGYVLHEAGNIPGFYTDIDTGRPGPKIAVFGELDSLIIPTHPDCDKQTGAVHACGHHCQSAALLGVAAALKTPGALDNMSGSIRLIAVPAEELIELDYRRELKEKGIIKFYGGKVEFLYRGYLDGVDLAFMVHTGILPEGRTININQGMNGCIAKTATFIGKSAHAGGGPHLGINALYAATTAIDAANALRETFRDADQIRFHPIITEGGTVVNAIPEKAVVSSFVRGSNIEALKNANDKVNRAFAGAAAAIGCKLKLCDVYGYSPHTQDKNLVQAAISVGKELFGEDSVNLPPIRSSGSSDIGDISSLIPAIHPGVYGACGTPHGSDYRIKDKESAVLKSAAFQSCMLCHLLSDGACLAKKTISEKQVVFSSKEQYFAFIESMNKEIDAVTANNDETLTIRYK